MYNHYFNNFGRPPVPDDFMQRFSPKASSVLKKKIFKGFYDIWAWRPSWSMNRNHFSNLSFPQPKEASYQIWAKLAQQFQRRNGLKMLTDGCMDDGQKVITIAHPEHSSGELTSEPSGRAPFLPQGYNLNNLRRSPSDEVTHHISEAWAV